MEHTMDMDGQCVEYRVTCYRDYLHIQRIYIGQCERMVEQDGTIVVISDT